MEKYGTAPVLSGEKWMKFLRIEANVAAGAASCYQVRIPGAP